jgi:pilus assembly protein FimV
MTQSNLLELAQQGDPQAIAALMNQSLQPRGMTATVERAGDSLSVLLEADQVPNRQTLTAFVYRGISNLGVGSIRSVKVLGQQTGTNLPVWTQDLTLELPTTAADAIDAVDLSPTNLSPTVDSMADVSPSDDLANNLNGHLDFSSEPNEMDLSLADLSSEFSAEDPSDELDALWVAPSDEPSEDSLADLLSDEPGSASDLDGLFDEQPEVSVAAGGDNPLEDLRGMFGDRSEDDFPPLEESSMNGAGLNGTDSTHSTDNLEDLFGEDLEEGSPAELVGTFDEPGLESDLSADLGMGSDDSGESDDLAAFFGDDRADAALGDEDLGMMEETPVDQEDFQDLFGETAPPSAIEPDIEPDIESELLDEPVSESASWSLLDDEEPESTDQLMSFLGAESSVESEPTSTPEPLNFLAEEPLPELSFSEESEESANEPALDDLTNDLTNDLTGNDLTGNALTGDDSFLGFLDEEPPVTGGDLDDDLFGDRPEETSDDPLSFDEPVASENEPIDEPMSLEDLGSFDEPVSFDEPMSFDEPFSEPEPLANVADVSDYAATQVQQGETITAVNFQEQQALADFFADDPLADFLEQPVQPMNQPEEEFLEGGLSEPMAAATAQDYFSSDDPVSGFQDDDLTAAGQFQPQDDRDFLSDTFQPESEPADLFSERMDDLESIDTWNGALENPLPDVEVNQADAISSLESLTDDSDLPEVPTETWLNEPAFDRQPETEPEHLHESQPRWDLDSDEEPSMLDNLALPAMGAGAVGAGIMSARDAGIEDLTVSLPNLPQDDYEPVAYPSLNDPTQAPPQQKGSPWIFPLVLFGLTGWVLALIGFSYWLKDRDEAPTAPIVQPSAESPVPSVPPAPANPPAAPSSAVPDGDENAAIGTSEEVAIEEPDFMSVD